VWNLRSTAANRFDLIQPTAGDHCNTGLRIRHVFLSSVRGERRYCAGPVASVFRPHSLQGPVQPCRRKADHVKMILSLKFSRVNSKLGREYFRMDEFIAKANIEHFKTQLKTETDEGKRRVLERLLAEEEQKLAEALRRKLTK
jgi:hypothetical protein